MMLKDNIDDCPSVWFARMERARNLGDKRREAEAIKNLRRLGVEIRWQGGKPEGGDHE